MYRLRVVLLRIPPLRERRADLEALTWHFIDQFNARRQRQIYALSVAAWTAIQAYPWPGNVRELRNNLEACFVLGDGPVLQLDELAPEVQDQSTDAPAAPSEATLEVLERQALLEAFRKTGGQRSLMAERLGISRSTLYRRLKQHGLT